MTAGWYKTQKDRITALEERVAELQQTDGLLPTVEYLLTTSSVLLSAARALVDMRIMPDTGTPPLGKVKLCVKCETPIADPQLEGDEKCEVCSD